MKMHWDCLRQHSPNSINHHNLVGIHIRMYCGSQRPRVQLYGSASSAKTSRNCQFRNYLLLNPPASPISPTAEEKAIVWLMDLSHKNLCVLSPAQWKLFSEDANARGSTTAVNSSLPLSSSNTRVPHGWVMHLPLTFKKAKGYREYLN